MTTVKIEARMHAEWGTLGLMNLRQAFMHINSGFGSVTAVVFGTQPRATVRNLARGSDELNKKIPESPHEHAALEPILNQP